MTVSTHYDCNTFITQLLLYFNQIVLQIILPNQIVVIFVMNQKHMCITMLNICLSKYIKHTVTHNYKYFKIQYETYVQFWVLGVFVFLIIAEQTRSFNILMDYLYVLTISW